MIRIERTEQFTMPDLHEEQYHMLQQGSAIQKHLADEDTLGFNLIDGERIIGFAMLRCRENTCFLWDLLIEKSEQGRGRGRVFLELLIAHLKHKLAIDTLTTTYIQGNEIARKLYKTMGFVEMETDAGEVGDVDLSLDISARRQAYRIQAFIKDGRGGNPAGIVFGHDSAEQMQQLATQLGFSETVFIEYDRGWHLRYFTPTVELGFCGHASLAAYSFLRQCGLVDQGQTSFRCAEGEYKIEVWPDGRILLGQQTAVFSEQIEEGLVAPTLGLPQKAIIRRPQVVSTGLRDLFIELRNRSDLGRIALDESACTELCNAHDITSFHVFTMEEGTIYCRNFGPAVGIPEESATGSAGGALCAWLFETGRLSADRMIEIIQGEAMGETSLLFGRVQEDGTPWIGGYCSELHIIK